MLRIFSAVLTAILVFFSITSPMLIGNHKNVNEDYDSLVRPDTWALTDGLGRSAPMKGEVKAKDSEKFVGMFYWTWHTQQSRDKVPKNVTELLKKDPSAIRDFSSSLWENTYSGYPYFWNEPIYGYYVDIDEYVLRKQAELIADAGVDVLFFDCTNETALWEESYEQLFKVFENARADGINVPQVAFLLPFWDFSYMHTDLVNLYEKIYSKDRYKDLWFVWDGKPLILCDKNCLDVNIESDKKLYDFFTFRDNDPSYFSKNTSIKKETWGWCSSYPQTKYGWSLNGDVEQMCVSVAQNAARGKLVAMNADDKVQGRAYSKGIYSYSYEYGGKKIKATSSMDNAYLYGINFQQQWDRAIKCDPEFVFVTGWNEWIAGRWLDFQGTENAFPDQFTDEYSRDCEPSKGILKDYYYCQLVENIRRFKGVSDTVEPVDGVKTFYHYTNNTYERNCRGWGDTVYSNSTMRNDFTKAEVSDDGNYIYMSIYTKDAITPFTDKSWMRILIDTDAKGLSANWEGFEYIINRENASSDKVIIEKSTGGWNFYKSGEAEYTVDGNVMKLKISVSAIGLSSNNVKFNFKLSDNMQDDGDIMDFYVNGDAAPGGRFTFVY